MRARNAWAGRGPGRGAAWLVGGILGILMFMPRGAAGDVQEVHGPAWAGTPAVHRHAVRIAQADPTAGSRPGVAADTRIEIKDFAYSPATLTVAPGTTVTWTSRDDEPHTVTSRDSLFTSGGLDADESFSYTFTTPGTYTYFCKLHPEMNGTIVVK